MPRPRRNGSASPMAEQFIPLRQSAIEVRCADARKDGAACCGHAGGALGLCVLDAQGRLLNCNPRFAEIYGLSPEQVTPGRAVTELLPDNKPLSSCSANPDARSGRPLGVGGGQSFAQLTQTRDGRVVC